MIPRHAIPLTAIALIAGKVSAQVPPRDVARRAAIHPVATIARAFDNWSSGFQFTEIGQRYHDASRSADSAIGTIDRRKLSALLMAALPKPPEISLQETLADDLEIARLRRELDRARMERDILKKAVGIFAEMPR